VNPHEAIDRDFDAHLERIRDFLGIPSVSAHGGDLRSTADTVCELIDLAGGTAAPREPGEKRPTVIGVIEGPGRDGGAAGSAALLAAQPEGRAHDAGGGAVEVGRRGHIAGFLPPISATRERNGCRACSVRAIAWPASAEPVNATPSM
jgi:acetylornithine deacetylase/succinyl-diaminopimelate desuccinylase-like protein